MALNLIMLDSNSHTYLGSGRWYIGKISMALNLIMLGSNSHTSCRIDEIQMWFPQSTFSKWRKHSIDAFSFGPTTRHFEKVDCGNHICISSIRQIVCGDGTSLTYFNPCNEPFQNGACCRSRSKIPKSVIAPFWKGSLLKHVVMERHYQIQRHRYLPDVSSPWIRVKYVVMERHYQIQRHRCLPDVSSPRSRCTISPVPMYQICKIENKKSYFFKSSISEPSG